METYDQLRERLDNYPQDLDTVYRQLLDQIEGPSTAETLLCLYLVSHSIVLKSTPSTLDVSAVLSHLSTKPYFSSKVNPPPSLCRFAVALKSRLGHLIDLVESTHIYGTESFTVCPNCREAGGADCDHEQRVNIEVRLIHKSLHRHLMNYRPLYTCLSAEFFADYNADVWVKLLHEIWLPKDHQPVTYRYLRMGALRSISHWDLGLRMPAGWEAIKSTLSHMFRIVLEKRSNLDWLIGLCPTDVDLIQAVAKGTWKHADDVYKQRNRDLSTSLPHLVYALCHNASTTISNTDVSGWWEWVLRCLDAMGTVSMWSACSQYILCQSKGNVVELLELRQEKPWLSFLFDANQ